MSSQTLEEQILQHKHFAVLGASRDRAKYGYKVYQKIKAAGYTVYAINPNADEIDGDPCYPSLDNTPASIDCLVTVTPPQVTEEALHLAGRLRIPFVWMQPGSESNAAYNTAQSAGIQVVSGGPCIMQAIAARKGRR